MNTAILPANLKEIGRCLLVVKVKYRKLIVLSEYGIYRTKHTIGCSSQGINHAWLIIGG